MIGPCLPGTDTRHVRSVAAYSGIALRGLQAGVGGVDLVPGQGQVAETHSSSRCWRSWLVVG